jgi:long-chain fatty acid transport protein
MKKSLSGLLYLLCFGIVSIVVSTTAYATNGMNMEGYGPIATGMGGASMAYDNGTAALMNNPATLGLMPQGDRLDVALGFLGPNVKATCEVGPCAGQTAASSGSAYYMPALGWVRKSGQFSYGIGMFGQGGMGTEYSGDSFMAAGSGEKVRSEVSMGRVLVPFAYEVNKDLSIAATADFVWVGMDLKMALSGAQFLDMAGSFGGSEKYGSVSGSMMTAFGNAVQGGMISDPYTHDATGAVTGYSGNPSPVNWGRFDFSDESNMTGKAKGTGFAGKIGGTYKVSDVLTIGAAYHSKTAMSDLETNGAKVSFNANVDTGLSQGQAATGVYVPATIPVTGKIEVKDFEWPQMAGIGMAYQVMDNLMIVADYKWINWADVMKNFKMTFTADATQTGLAQGFAGTELDATLFQKWKDQHVIMIGAAYKVSPEWVLRAGLNYANNPIPDTYLNALFPAIEKSHIMIGAGYMISKASSVDASFTYAPEVKQTSDSGVTSTHSQTNAQAMYSYRF